MALNTRLMSLSKELSVKIFDPVSIGNADGKQFVASLRLSYINRAFGELLRLLELLSKDIAQIITNYFITEEIKITNGIGDLSGETVLDVYYTDGNKIDGELTWKKASKIVPEDYLSVKKGINTQRKASDEVRFWTVINNKLLLLPADASYANIEIIAKNSFEDLQYDSGADLLLRNDYKDILLNLAASFAMEDLGDVNKVGLYLKAHQFKIETLTALKNSKDVKDIGVS